MNYISLPYDLLQDLLSCCTYINLKKYSSLPPAHDTTHSSLFPMIALSSQGKILVSWRYIISEYWVAGHKGPRFRDMSVVYLPMCISQFIHCQEVPLATLLKAGMEVVLLVDLAMKKRNEKRIGNTRGMVEIGNGNK